MDARLPRAFARQLVDRDATSVHPHGWADLDDGALLDACAALAVDVFVILDQSVRVQQNLRGRPVAALLLRARSNRIHDLAPLVPAVLDALPKAQPGQITVVGA